MLDADEAERLLRKAQDGNGRFSFHTGDPETVFDYIVPKNVGLTDHEGSIDVAGLEPDEAYAVGYLMATYRFADGDDA